MNLFASKCGGRRVALRTAVLAAVMFGAQAPGFADQLGYRGYVQAWDPAKPAVTSAAVGPVLYGGFSTDLVNAFACSCATGWTGPTCEQDIDECTAGSDDCDDDPAACINITGSFRCICPAGYSGNGVGASGCVDVDECRTGTASCDRRVTCTNLPGSYTCGNCPAVIIKRICSELRAGLDVN